MYQCDGADCSYAMPSLSSLRGHCQRCYHAQREGDCRSTRQERGVNVLQWIIAVPKMSDKEVVVNEGNTFCMGGNEVLVVSEKMNRNDLDKAGDDEASFVDEIAHIISSMVSVLGNLTMFALLEIIHSSNFDSNGFEKQV